MRFDRFIAESHFDDGKLTRELVLAWSVQRPNEGKGYRKQRAATIGPLALYMISLGVEAYILHNTGTYWIPDPYILTGKELHDFFETVDNFRTPQYAYKRFSPAYSTLFRLYYCCGLRLSEGINLLRTDINFENGIINVRHSKGDKDRAVFMSPDVVEMCRGYDSQTDEILPNRKWFFPGRNPMEPFKKSSIDARFKELWEKTYQSMTRGKIPTVHSLRHTYVVMRINGWMAEGLDIAAMMPYLSRQLGHSTVDGTQYYYHTSVSSLSIVREHDTMSGMVMPPVIEMNNLTVCEIDNPQYLMRTHLKTTAVDKDANRVIAEVHYENV
jgi:integrase